MNRHFDAPTLRRAFISFFTERGHADLPSASLIPEKPLQIAESRPTDVPNVARAGTRPAIIERVDLAPPAPPVAAFLPDAPVAMPVLTAEAAPLIQPASYEVQAGAFSSLANAQRAQATLAVAGDVQIKPLERDGAILYRVVVGRIPDETQALAMIDRVGGLGFPDARLLRPF